MKRALVIVIVGPTASGKTSLAVRLAKEMNGEVISADSMQIYKGMDIATAKPTAEEMGGIRHHLIDFLPANESFSVAKFKQLAENAIDDIISRGKTPIIAGGTGLYVSAVVDNTSFLDCGNSDIRQKLEKRAEQEGIETLFEELKSLDAETAEKLHINDSKRIIRALELYYSTGQTMTKQRELSHLEQSRFDFCIIGLNAHDRQFLYDRINRRVDIMLENGLIDEAKAFYSSDYSNTAKQAIGYKELKPYIDGEVSLDEAVEKLKTETRRYAKRQLTWFRKMENIHWIYIDDTQSEPLGCAREIIKSFESERL